MVKAREGSEGQCQDQPSKDLGVQAKATISGTTVPVVHIKTTQIKGTTSRTAILDVNFDMHSNQPLLIQMKSARENCTSQTSTF
jgi:hypothetical protein